MVLLYLRKIQSLKLKGKNSTNELNSTVDTIKERKSKPEKDLRKLPRNKTWKI